MVFYLRLFGCHVFDATHLVMMPKGINVGFWVYECFVAVMLN